MARHTRVYSAVQVTVVRKVQESSSPDTQEQIKELNLRHLSYLVASCYGKSVWMFNFWARKQLLSPNSHDGLTINTDYQYDTSRI